MIYTRFTPKMLQISNSKYTAPLLLDADGRNQQYGSVADLLPNIYKHVSPPPPTAYSTSIILFTFCACSFCVSLCYALIMPFFPQEAVRKGGNGTLSGVVLASYMFAMLTMSPFVSQVALRYGVKTTLLTGVAIAGSCTIILGVLDRVPAGSTFFILAILTRLLEGLGSVAYNITSMTLRTTIFSSNFAFAFVSRNFCLFANFERVFFETSSKSFFANWFVTFY